MNTPDGRTKKELVLEMFRVVGDRMKLADFNRVMDDKYKVTISKSFYQKMQQEHRKSEPEPKLEPEPEADTWPHGPAILLKDLPQVMTEARGLLARFDGDKRALEAFLDAI